MKEAILLIMAIFVVQACVTNKKINSKEIFSECFSKTEALKIFTQNKTELQTHKLKILEPIGSEPNITLENECGGLYFVTFKTENPKANIVLPALKYGNEVYFRGSDDGNDSIRVDGFRNRYKGVFTEDKIKKIEKTFLEYYVNTYRM
jgi:hypothetical protein